MACDIAAAEEFHPADEESLRPAYASEFSGVGVLYIIDDTTVPNPSNTTWRRLVFLPMSWPGITLDELEPVHMPSLLRSRPPWTIWTVPFSTACMAYIRLVSRETRHSPLRLRGITDPAMLIGYSFYDVSHEGDYGEIVPNEVPLSAKEILEIGNAVREVKSWEMKDGEEWMREHLVGIVSAKSSYHDLPWKA